MKHSPLLVAVLFLIFSQTCWGDGASQGGYFNEYVNSPEGPVVSLVNKEINPTPAAHDKFKEHSVKEDSQAVLQGISAKWQACSVSSDCTAVVADCALWEPLNKKYLNRIAENLNSCSASIDPGFQPETVCVHKACQLTEKTTHVSWEEWLSQMRKKKEQFK